MKKIVIFLGLSLILISGCATSSKTPSPPAIGSSLWHKQRIEELEKARSEKTISEEKYFELKTETDRIRSDYTRSTERPVRFYYGLGYGQNW